MDEDFKNLLSKDNNWVKINDPKSQWTIEDFPYETGVDERITNPHCWKCVVVNNCWFVNEPDKKPQTMNYSFDLIRDLLGKSGLNVILGLYHPNCHCKELSISRPNENQIQLVVPPKKLDWTFKDKGHLLKEMGYKDNEFLKAIEVLLQLVKKAFADGQYMFRVCDEKGYRIGFVLDFPGKNEDKDKIYKLKTGWTIFPNGKLKNNTLIGGLKK